MKILSVNKYFYLKGGSERYYFELNRLHSKNGHIVIPFSTLHEKNYPSEFEKYFINEVKYWEGLSNTKKIRTALNVIYSFESKRKIEKLINKVKPNIAHLHLICHQISPSIFPVLKKYNIPIVQTHHDYKLICPTYSLVSKNVICERCKGKKYYNAIIQRCNHESLMASSVNALEMYLNNIFGWYNMPDVHITPSKFMRDKLIEHGFPGDNIVHVPHFVDTKQYIYKDESQKYFIYFGRLHTIKGIKTLISAMSMIKASGFKLLIIGDGPQREDLEGMSSALRLENVSFVGYKNGKNLKDIISKALFSIIPSEVYEIFGLTIVESMALGKPVIGARIGGIPELINDGEDGLLFQSGNALDLSSKIQQLIDNPELCREMGIRGRQKIQLEFNETIHYQNIKKIYDNLLNK